jgi:hypothetical protein
MASVSRKSKAVQDGVAKDFGVHVAYSGADMSNPASIAEMVSR